MKFSLSLKYIATYASVKHNVDFCNTLCVNENTVKYVLNAQTRMNTMNILNKLNPIEPTNAELDQIFVNDMLDYNNIHDLMYMTHDSYLYINDSTWKDIPYNTTIDISLGIPENTVQGYVFSDKLRNLNIISIKGTTLTEIFGYNNFRDFGLPKNDKINDNLFYSCCFYKQSKIFKNILDNTCKKKGENKKSCSKKCFSRASDIEVNYLTIGDSIVSNLRNIIDFDNSRVIFTGHSLGGTIATYLGIKYNKPVITFNSPGEKKYFDLAGISKINKQNHKNIYHFGHNADTIINGNCGSLCWLFGYNINTKCHIGNTCMYNAKDKLGLSESIYTHRLTYLIDTILPNWRDDFPKCKSNVKCNECKKWNYT